MFLSYYATICMGANSEHVELDHPFLISQDTSMKMGGTTLRGTLRTVRIWDRCSGPPTPF